MQGSFNNGGYGMRQHGKSGKNGHVIHKCVKYAMERFAKTLEIKRRDNEMIDAVNIRELFKDDGR
jgi:hypothetical protein